MIYHISIYPTVAHFSRCECGHTINELGIHLLCCLYGSEHITTHDTLRDTIVTITSKSGTHIRKKVSHLLPHHAWKQVDIVITRYSFWTLTNIAIVDSTCPNLVHRALTITLHATTIATQDKAWSYTKQALKDDFIPLTIKTYGCLHLRLDSFFISYIHVYITCH